MKSFPIVILGWRVVAGNAAEELENMTGTFSISCGVRRALVPRAHEINRLCPTLVPIRNVLLMAV